MQNNNVINQELFDFILENVKLLLNITPLSETSSDEEKADYDNKLATISLYINIICKEIIIKTNRNEFPEDLKYLVINSTVEMYNQYMLSTNSDESQTIESISENGRSVTYGTSATTKIKFQLLAQQQILTNEKLINRYKLLYKVRCPHEQKN